MSRKITRRVTSRGRGHTGRAVGGYLRPRVTSRGRDVTRGRRYPPTARPVWPRPRDVTRRVIFLDIDGVVAPIRRWDRYGDLEPACIDVLNEIVAGAGASR